MATTPYFYRPATLDIPATPGPPAHLAAAPVEAPYFLDRSMMPDTPTHMAAAAPVEGPTADGLSDVQRLISTIEASFAGMRESSGEQAQSLNATLEKMSTAVQALKEQPPSSDKQTAFWTAYKTLADEFDKEFQRKYGNDLDTSLIFAGLFSAVSSAFIIQIQPEFQPNPNATMEALLIILVQNITSIPPGMQISPQSNTPIIIVVAQSLLYISLFSTLLAALLAVLGKQWLLHYDSVGERGTIEERGLERQRKFDGLRRWKFDLIMQIFPLLLQFSLLLFAVALSIYLWTIHHVIAWTVLVLTCLASILYTLMVVSALAVPDSPFQTSLTALLGIVINLIPLSPLWGFTAATGRCLHACFQPLQRSLSSVWSVSSGFMKVIPPLLPRFNLRKSPPVQPVPIFGDIPEPSEQVPAVVWALETSTDPRLVEAAAAVVPDLQWPTNLDLRPSLRRLSDLFNRCFNYDTLREGMGDRAASSIIAFGVLEMVTKRHEGWSDMWTFEPYRISGVDAELRSMFDFFHLSRRREQALSFDIDSSVRIAQWPLRFIPVQDSLTWDNLRTVLGHFHPFDLSLFGDFLFCVNSFFVPAVPCDLSRMDKSDYCVLLLTHLFTNLTRSLKDSTNQLDPYTAEKILHRIVEFNLGLHYHHTEVGDQRRLRHAVYCLCDTDVLKRSTTTALLQLVRRQWLWGMDELAYLEPSDMVPSNSTADVTWVYIWLEELYASNTEDTMLIHDLIQVLFSYTPIQTKPSTTALRAMLSTIIFNVGEFNNETRYLTFRVLSAAQSHWFQDNDLRAVLQEHSVWARLGVLDIDGPHRFKRDITFRYIALGSKLSKIPEWKTAMLQDLPGWLSHLPRLLENPEIPTKEFCAVLSHVWDVNVTEDEDQRPITMSFMALANFWDQFNFSAPHKIHYIIALIKCTVATALLARICPVPELNGWWSDKWRLQTASPQFKDTIIRLGDAVIRAADRASQAFNLNQDFNGTVAATADLLSRVGLMIVGELRNWRLSGNTWAEENAEIDHWQKLRETFYSDLENLPQLLPHTAHVVADQVSVESAE